MSDAHGTTLPGLAEQVYVALFEDSATDRAAARAALAASLPPWDALVAGLLGGLRADATRLRALEAIAEMGERAVTAADPLALVAQRHEVLAVRVAAAYARGRVAPRQHLDATPFALALVLGEREEKHEAIALLSALGPTALPAAPALAKVLESEDLVARQQATLALSKIGVDALELALRCPVAAVRRHAVILLDRRTGELSRAVPMLARMLSDRHAGVRRAAAVSLGRCGAWARCAIPALLHALSDDDPEVRWWSALAAAGLSMRTPDVMTHLADAAECAPVDLRQRASGVLAKLGWGLSRAA